MVNDYIIVIQALARELGPLMGQLGVNPVRRYRRCIGDDSNASLEPPLVDVIIIIPLLLYHDY